MARKKRDFGPLLEKFGNKQTRPPLRGRKDIRLPPLAELERIDAAAERAAADARINGDERGPVGMDSETSDSERQTTSGYYCPEGTSWPSVAMRYTNRSSSIHTCLAGQTQKTLKERTVLSS
jgi:hypothetical protein